MKSAKSILQRFSLCAVLQRSAPEVLHALVKHQALLVLQAWLVDSINLQKPKLASRVLGCLAKLPVTTASLQPPCELGKLVGKLRKEPGMDQATQEAAKQLVAKWKKTVEEESKRLLLELFAWLVSVAQGKDSHSTRVVWVMQFECTRC